MFLGFDSAVSRSELFRDCADLDAKVSAFRDRDFAPLARPYVFNDASYCTARSTTGWCSQTVVVAFGVASDGRREAFGFDVDDGENEAFWID